MLSVPHLEREQAAEDLAEPALTPPAELGLKEVLAGCKIENLYRVKLPVQRLIVKHPR